MAWGNYVTVPGYPMMTQWFGELKENRDGSYGIMFVAHLGTSADPPTSPPEIAALKGTAQMLDCDTFTARYDFLAVWDWGSTPFVDEPYATVKTDFTENYRRITVP